MRLRWHNLPQHRLASYQRFLAQVSPVKPQQIENVETGLYTSVQQVIELRAAFGIQAHDLAVLATFKSCRIESQRRGKLR